MDLGLSPTMNREMARSSALPDQAAETQSFARTLETIYAVIGLALGLLLVLLAPFLANQWLGASSLPVEARMQSLRLMGVLAFAQWPLTLYQGGLNGLQRQVRLTILQIAMSTFRHGGAVTALLLVAPTLETLLIWHCFAAAVQTVLLRIVFWASLPQTSTSPRFDVNLVKRVRRFAAGMSVGSLVSIALTQLPNILLIRLLSTRAFADYSLAASLSAAVGLLIVPVYNAVAPRITALVAANDDLLLRRFYHFSTQTISVVVMPVSVVLAFFAFDLSLIWQQNVELATGLAPIVAVLAIGSLCHGWAHIPSALQIAHGWTRIGVLINVVMIVILMPATFVLTRLFGGLGAAMAWSFVLITYLAMVGPLTHRVKLRGESVTWYLRDIAIPFIGVVVVVGVGRAIIPAPSTPAWASLGALFLVWGMAVIAAVALSTGIRSWVVDVLRRGRGVETQR